MLRTFRTVLIGAVILASIGVYPATGVAPTRTGVMPPVIGEGFRSGLFRLREPLIPRLQTSAQQPLWRVPVILVGFTDQPLVYTAEQGWDLALFDSTGATPTGSVFDYYRWASGGRLRVTGQVVASVPLTGSKGFYAHNSWGLSIGATPRNSYGVVDEAVRTCDAAVDWAPFDRDHDGYVDMVWVVHSGLAGENTVSRDNLWSITSEMRDWTNGGAFITNDLVPGSVSQMIRIDAFSILPELSAFRPGSRAEIGVYCHEFGHALGLPDLYDTAPQTAAFNVGPGNWSLMSTGMYGTNGASPEFPSHLGAWPTLFLGWNSTVRPTQDSLLVLGPIESGSPILDLWFQGEYSSEHYLIENRQRLGFDQHLLQEGLIVYRVDDAAIGARLGGNQVNVGPRPALRIVEADGRDDLVEGLSRGSSRDPFPGALNVTTWDENSTPSTRSFSGAATNVALRTILAVGDSMRFLAQVRARGWVAPRLLTDGSFAPTTGAGPASRAVRLDDGDLALVTSELIGGRSQIVLRARENQLWEPPLQLSASSGSASDPTVAALPGDDLGVVWSDTRHGTSELYYRSRIRGVWTPEQRLTDLDGSSRSPSLAADARGGLHLAWLLSNPIPRVMFLYFPYFSPFGDPVALTGTAEQPDAPVVAASPSGASFTVWPERNPYPTTLWFARFKPDSGTSPRLRLTPTNGGAQPGVNAVVDSIGRLHAVWQVSSPNAAEIRYQLRGPNGPAPTDTIIERRGEPLQNLSLSLDREGGLHVVMEALAAGIPQLRHKYWEPGYGWQMGATEVTLPGEETAARPAVLAENQGLLTVLYTGYPDGAPALVERRRNVEGFALTSAGFGGPANASMNVAPNPLREGFPLKLGGPIAPGAGVWADVFDLSGRVMSSVPLETYGDRWVASFSVSRTQSWPSGVYFARVRGTGTTARFVVLR